MYSGQPFIVLFSISLHFILFEFICLFHALYFPLQFIAVFYLITILIARFIIRVGNQIRIPRILMFSECLNAGNSDCEGTQLKELSSFKEIIYGNSG